MASSANIPQTRVFSSYYILVLFLYLFSMNSGCTPDYYTAAVFEHAPVDSVNRTADEIIGKNLYLYERAAKVAKSKGADIIVFPEYGLFPPIDDRKQIKAFLENIPDPKNNPVNPCQESTTVFKQGSILRTLSCMAKYNSIYLVANMGDIQGCQGEPKCPPDGVFQFNTNVVFDRSGTLLQKYHKEHLFVELSLNQPLKEQDPTFKTEFGTFATYICFDSVFGRMSKVAHWPSVDGIMFSSMWLNPPPQFTSMQYWQGWALGNKVPLIAANIQLPGKAAMGSGIFHNRAGALGYTFNPDGKSKLVVATVPSAAYYSIPPNPSITIITENEIIDFTDDGKDIRKDCSMKILGETTDMRSDYRCLEEDTTNYTFARLTDANGHVDVCNNGLCCSLDYSTNGLKESFFLGAYNGTFLSANTYVWAEENCVLARCDAFGDNPCAIFPQRSNTSFYHVKLRGNFTTEFAYPSVVSSGMRLVPRAEWDHRTNLVSTTSVHNSVIHFRSHVGEKLIAVGFKGRCYDRDPPFPKS